MAENTSAMRKGENFSSISEFLFVALFRLKGRHGARRMRFDEFASDFRRWLQVIGSQNQDFVLRIGNGRGLKDALESLAARNLVKISYGSLEPTDREFPFYELTPFGEDRFKQHRAEVERNLGVSFDEVEDRAEKLKGKGIIAAPES